MPSQTLRPRPRASVPARRGSPSARGAHRRLRPSRADAPRAREKPHTAPMASKKAPDANVRDYLKREHELNLAKKFVARYAASGLFRRPPVARGSGPSPARARFGRASRRPAGPSPRRRVAAPDRVRSRPSTAAPARFGPRAVSARPEATGGTRARAVPRRRVAAARRGGAARLAPRTIRAARLRGLFGSRPRRRRDCSPTEYPRRSRGDDAHGTTTRGSVDGIARLRRRTTRRRRSGRSSRPRVW